MQRIGRISINDLEELSVRERERYKGLTRRSIDEDDLHRFSVLQRSGKHGEFSASAIAIDVGQRGRVVVSTLDRLRDQV